MAYKKDDGNHPGSAKVYVDAAGVIMCVLKGYIDEAVVRKSLAETRLCVGELQAQGKSVYLLIDAAEVTGQSSGARSLTKSMGKMGLDKLAVVNTNAALGMVIQYLIRAAGLSKQSKTFRTRRAAQAWVRGRARSTTLRERDFRWLTAVAAGTLAASALLGWAIDNDILKSLASGLKPMNPVSAITILLLAVAVLLLRKGTLSRWRTVGITAIACGSVLYGVLAWARTMLGWNLHIDTWLVGGKLNMGTYTGLTSPRAAFCILLLGVMLLAILSGQRWAWQRLVFHIASIAVFAAGLGSIIGYAFGLKELQSIMHFLPMPLNTAICVLLLAYALQAMSTPMHFFARAGSALGKYAPAAAIFAVVMLITGMAWQQSKVDVQHNISTATIGEFKNRQADINDRVSGYVNALRGFRSFFEASDFVSAKEYNTYFASSDLQQNYPGFLSVVFVRNVPRQNQAAVVGEMRAQGKDDPPYKDFAIRPASDRSVLYPVLYVAPRTATTRFGLDLGFSDDRRLVLEKARDTGDLAATGTINLNASREDNTMRSGFFITIPVYQRQGEFGEPKTIAERRAHIYGFINAYFEDKMLFGDIFRREQQHDIRYVIRNARTDDVLYTYNSQGKHISAEPQYVDTVAVAGQIWRVELYTRPHYGVGSLSQQLPSFVLGGGTLLALLGGALMLAQARRREQALTLAASMTEDLNNERNRAVATQQKDELILGGIGEGLIITDKSGHITLINKAAERFLGHTMEELAGEPFEKVLIAQDEKGPVPLKRRPLQRSLRHGKTVSQPMRYIRNDGTMLDVQATTSPIVLHGKIEGAIEIFRDVTKERQLERAKSEFVSLASHQLRTPLSAINWYAEMLLAGDAGRLNKDQREYMTEIFEGNRRMVELVDSLLNVSRLEVGKLKNEPADTSMLELADSLHKELTTSIATKQIVFAREAPAKLPLVYADPKLLRMILQNLLSNAVKYTPAKGKVTLTLRKATAADLTHAKLQNAQSFLFVSVSDTGYGIPKDQQEKIFGKLFRADNVRKMDVEGTGLGLYIVKEVVEKLGGRVWFTSTESVGTTFYVVLPLTTKATSKDA